MRCFRADETHVDTVRRVIKEYYERISKLEDQKFDLEYIVKKKDFEVRRNQSFLQYAYDDTAAFCCFFKIFRVIRQIIRFRRFSPLPIEFFYTRNINHSLAKRKFCILYRSLDLFATCRFVILWLNVKVFVRKHCAAEVLFRAFGYNVRTNA